MRVRVEHIGLSRSQIWKLRSCFSCCTMAPDNGAFPNPAGGHAASCQLISASAAQPDRGLHWGELLAGSLPEEPAGILQCLPGPVPGPATEVHVVTERGPACLGSESRTALILSAFYLFSRRFFQSYAQLRKKGPSGF